MLYEQIRSSTERGVGRDAGVAVRAAALEPEREVARRNLLALDLVCFRQQVLDTGDALGHGLLGAAGVLDGEGLQLVAALEILRGQQVVDLVRFAAKADHQRSMKIRMRRVAGEHPAQQRYRFTFGAHATAGLVMDRHHAIDVRVLRHEVFVEVLGDHAADVRRAVHAGDDREVVAGGDAAVGALDAHKGGGVGSVFDRLVVGTERVIALEVAHRQVVHMHVIARLDRLGGETDDLVVAADRVTRLQFAGRDLVSGRNGDGGAHLFLDDFGAGGQLGARDDHIVGGVQADRQVSGLQHFWSPWCTVWRRIRVRWTTRGAMQAGKKLYAVGRTPCAPDFSRIFPLRTPQGGIEKNFPRPPR